MGEILKAFNNKKAFSGEDWRSVVYFIVLKLFNILITNNVQILKIFLSFDINTLIKGLLFEKIGRINPHASCLEKGRLVNLVQNDATTIGSWVYSLIELICFPFSIGMNLLLLLIHDLAMSAVILSLIACTTYLCVWLAFQYKKVNQRLLKARDGRLKIINDAFTDITSMKLLSWEDEIQSRVSS